MAFLLRDNHCKESRQHVASHSKCGAPPPRTAAQSPTGEAWIHRGTLQTISTCSALLGSAAAVGDAITIEDRTPDMPVLRLAAAVLIATSLVSEAIAYWKRRRQHRAWACESTPPARQAPLWRRWLWPLVAPTLLMAVFTALGASAVNRLGIIPRTAGGLWGIFFGCFVHLSWAHYAWNAFAFLLLGSCVLQALAVSHPRQNRPAREAEGDHHDHLAGRCGESPVVSVFAVATAFIAIASGLCVWVLAREAIHVGSSGIVCGYAGLFLALVVRQSHVPLGPLLMVLAVAACYGGAAILARPGGTSRICLGGICSQGRLTLYEACTSQTTSAEHHTFGFLSGLASALFFCRPTPGTDGGWFGHNAEGPLDEMQARPENTESPQGSANEEIIDSQHTGTVVG
mmetsp:Transcript_64570/g.154273  ORF Transcript_64570/g.154273 Transcript_64570/m.154273 type:complete len:400 (-) Transcript_64570:155-1354(-)|eukprot:CAMPEP_0178379464 /NCGR_PEP_ID=MMETSP0689_2-20121128/4956_1 /TAXON_ID=160604 /ORGANISM="Amphidinium massartii, Strain CS-259" /LENGTH=399 /DNA_ID=CAMNT_0019999567 /DNA_START=18 /DNA_END=1217 /DNA_ORIENTATION=+